MVEERFQRRLAAILSADAVGILAPHGYGISGRTYLFLVLRAGNRRIFRALKVGSASQVAPIDKLSVVLVALFGAVFLGEKLTVLNYIGIGLIAGGAFLVTLRS